MLLLNFKLYSSFAKNKLQYEEWTKDWSKVKVIFTKISLICGVLKQVAQQCKQNAILMSFMSTRVVIFLKGS